MRIFTALLLGALLAPAAHANLSLSKTYVTFYTMAGGYGPTDTVYVQNLSNTPVRVSVNSGCFSDFHVFDNCLGTLNPAASCYINISFNPRSRGFQTCSINVSGYPGSSHTIQVTGQAN